VILYLTNGMQVRADADDARDGLAAGLDIQAETLAVQELDRLTLFVLPKHVVAYRKERGE
jgi:hypothetical protein